MVWIKFFLDILIVSGVSKKVVRLIKTCLDGTQSKVRIGNYLSSSFPIENGLKQGDALSSLLLGRYKKLTWDWI